MATSLSKEENYVFGSGICYFAPFDANGRPMGERDLGNVPAFTLSVKSDKYEHTSARTATRKTDLSRTISVTFSGKLTFEDMSADNLALFLAGASTSDAQSSGTVTAERIYNAEADRYYQLGMGTDGVGVAGVSAVTVKVYEFTNASARANSTAYAVGDLFKSTTHVFVVTVAGTSAGSAPTFNTSAIGDSTTDGGATVKYVGETAAYTVDTDYSLDVDLARVGIVSGSSLGDGLALYYSVTSTYASLQVGYTKDANSRTKITSSATGSVTGQFRFVADNAAGTNRNVVISSCSLAPSGDVPFVTDKDIAKFDAEIGVNEKDSNTPLITIFGNPV